jgi:hypothetical protein
MLDEGPKVLLTGLHGPPLSTPFLPHECMTISFSLQSMYEVMQECCVSLPSTDERMMDLLKTRLGEKQLGGYGRQPEFINFI